MPAKERPRRDTFLTVGINGFQEIAPNVHLGQAVIPGDHWEQIVGHKLNTMDEHLRGISLEHMTHGDATDGVAGINFHLVDGDGVLSDMTDQRSHIWADGQGGSHHITHSVGASPGQSSSMHTLEFNTKSADPKLQEKLQKVGLNTSQAIEAMHNGVHLVEGTDENGKSINYVEVPPSAAVHKLIQAASKNPFADESYRSDDTIRMTKKDYDQAAKDLGSAIDATRIGENPFSGAEKMQVSAIYHGETPPSGTTFAHLKVTTEGEPVKPVPEEVKEKIEIDNKPAGMTVTKVTPYSA
jgi:hypothetical protein